MIFSIILRIKDGESSIIMQVSGQSVLSLRKRHCHLREAAAEEDGTKEGWCAGFSPSLSCPTARRIMCNWEGQDAGFRLPAFLLPFQFPLWCKFRLQMSIPSRRKISISISHIKPHEDTAWGSRASTHTPSRRILHRVVHNGAPLRYLPRFCETFSPFVIHRMRYTVSVATVAPTGVGRLRHRIRTCSSTSCDQRLGILAP